MRARLVQMGNSRGIRLPKPVIEEAGIDEEVELFIRDGAIVILPAIAPREGWAKAAQALAQRGGEDLLGAWTPTRFDAEEWEW